ncbi:putative phosphatase YwpJ [compost metagenome]
MKLIAIDLDGTLLTSESKPSKEGLDAIKATIAKQHKVAICTGRAYFDVKGLVGSELNIPIISSNGAAVNDEQGKLLKQTPISPESAAAAIQYLTEQGVYFEIFCPEAIYSPFDGEDKLLAEMDMLISANPAIDRDTLWKSALIQFQQFDIKPINDPMKVIRAGLPVYKLLIFTYDDNKLERIREYYSMNSSVHTTAAAQLTLEIIAKETDKGSALRYLAAHYGVPLSDTVVIGDNYNDVSMFRVAGTKIAMGNAVDEIKQLCTYVTLTNNEHGVAHALTHLLDL